MGFLQWIFYLSTFDLRKNYTVPKILVHQMFDLRKISKTPFFNLRKKNQAFWGKKGNFWQKILKSKKKNFVITKKTWKNCTWHPLIFKWRWCDWFKDDFDLRKFFAVPKKTSLNLKFTVLFYSKHSITPTVPFLTRPKYFIRLRLRKVYNAASIMKCLPRSQWNRKYFEVAICQQFWIWCARPKG